MSAPRTVNMMRAWGGIGGPFYAPQGRGTRFAGIGSIFDDAANAGKKILNQAEQQAQQAEQQAQQRAGQLIQTAEGAIPDPASIIKSITVDTAHLPQVKIVDPLKPAQPGIGSETTAALKPRITVEFNPIFGQQIKPVVYAPYGDPGDTDFDTWAALGALAVGLGAGVTVLGALSFFRGRKGGLLRRIMARRKAKRTEFGGASLPKSTAGKLALGYLSVGALVAGYREFKRYQSTAAIQKRIAAGAQMSVQPYNFDALDFGKAAFAWPMVVAGAFMSY